MDPQLRQRLDTKVYHLSCVGRDGRGGKTFDAPVERLCLREDKITTVRNVRGEEVTSSFRLYFDGVFAIKADDEFIVNGDTKQHPILSFSRFRGLRLGSGTTVVYL